MIVLGIDPGVANTGYGVVAQHQGRMLALDGGVVDGAVLRRSVGINGTRLSAVIGDELAGFIEVETLADAHRLARHGGWADVGNLRADDTELARWLVAQAADWLRLARVETAIAGKPRNEETAALAGEMAIEGATALRYNGYKIPLMRNLVKRAIRGDRSDT